MDCLNFFTFRTVGEQGQVYVDIGYHGVLGSWNPMTEHHASFTNLSWIILNSGYELTQTLPPN